MHITLHHKLNHVKHSIIIYSRHIYLKHMLSIPHVYIGSWIAHIEHSSLRSISLLEYVHADIHTYMHISIFIRGEVFLHWPHTVLIS